MDGVPCVGGGDEGRKPFWYRRLGDLEAQIPGFQPARAVCWGQGRVAIGHLHQAEEEHWRNADVASQHLAGILSASQTQATYLK